MMLQIFDINISHITFKSVVENKPTFNKKQVIPPSSQISKKEAVFNPLHFCVSQMILF